MRTNQKVRTIVRSQDTPFPEPGVIWIYKTKQQTDEGKVDVLILRYYENGEWKPIGSAINGKITPSGEVTKEDLENLKVLLEKEIQDMSKSFLQSMRNVTWATLKELRDNNQLTPGSYYRIIDYVATAVDTGEETSASIVKSANHPFDIIVQAIATNKLSEKASAELHAGDTYFANCKLNAWKIWYCLDNDKTRFTWADTINGKGVIYRMIDEYNNDISYDFKGLQFKRFAIATTYDLSGAETIIGLPIGHKGGGLGYTIDENTSKWYYTFSKLGSNWSDDVVDASLNGCAVEVVFTSVFSSNPRQDPSILLDNVFAYGQPVRDLCSVISGQSTEPIGDITYFSHITFVGANCAHNTFVAVPALSRTGATFRKNLIIGSFRHLEIGSNFQNNTFVMPYDFSFGSIGEDTNRNVVMCKGSFDRFTIGNYFIDNRLNLSGICQIASFGNYFYQNRIIGDSFSRVTFESNVGRNTFTSIDLSSVQMCGQLLDCTFSDKFMACTFNPICGYVDFVGGTNGEACVNLDVVGGIRGTSANRFHMECSDFIAQNAQGVQRRIRCEGDTNGNVVISWMSNGSVIRKTKGPSGDTWTTLA